MRAQCAQRAKKNLKMTRRRLKFLRSIVAENHLQMINYNGISHHNVT